MTENGKFTLSLSASERLDIGASLLLVRSGAGCPFGSKAALFDLAVEVAQEKDTSHTLSVIEWLTIGMSLKIAVDVGAPTHLLNLVDRIVDTVSPVVGKPNFALPS